MGGRHTLEIARVERLAEDSLMLIGERRVRLEKQQRLEHIIGGLEEASRIEHLRLQGHVAECRAQLREATEDLSRFEEIDAQRSEVHAEIVELLVEEQRFEAEAARSITLDAANAGFAYAREELFAEGAPGVLKTRRRTQPIERETPLSGSEVEAI